MLNIIQILSNQNEINRENGKYNLISVWFNKISKIFLCAASPQRKSQICPPVREHSDREELTRGGGRGNEAGPRAGHLLSNDDPKGPGTSIRGLGCRKATIFQKVWDKSSALSYFTANKLANLSVDGETFSTTFWCIEGEREVLVHGAMACGIEFLHLLELNVNILHLFLVHGIQTHLDGNTSGVQQAMEGCCL